MPWNPKRYPKDWKAIVAGIMERSGSRCECHGECGLHCTTGGHRRCVERHHEPAKFAKGRIVLTCAHLGVPKQDGTPGDKHDKMDCRPENLRMLCQRCHLRFDLDEHVRNAKATRERKRWKNQLALNGIEAHHV